MKFRKIQFENHPILGNCTFDFTDKDGNTVDTIIIAGENGCGKSVLLNEMFDFRPFDINDHKEGKMICDIELNDYECSTVNKLTAIQDKYNGNLKNRLQIVQDFSIKNSWDQVKVLVEGELLYQSGVIFYDSQLQTNQFFKKLYSDVEINFSPKQIKTVSAHDIDQMIDQYAIRSSSTLATDITQLLIDIKTSDDTDLSDWVSTHPEQVPPDSVKGVRMKRFTNAFHSIFRNKKFKGISNKKEHKVVLFEEFGRTMSIENLSSGEKQIVFRGGFLLKDKKSIEGAYVLVDEPEISLHPKWQLEILPFIKKLFTNEQGVQTSQIIVATHSPFIIHNSNRNNDKVIILQKDDKGQITVLDKPEYYSWTSNRIVEDAFNVSIDFQPNITYVFLEGETDELYYNKAMEVYDFDRDSIKFNWIGRNIGKGKTENTGDSALNSATLFFKSNPHIIKSNIVLLYDCDTNKPDEDADKLHVRMMQKNNANSLYKKGIENLLNLPAEFDYKQYYSYKHIEGDYGENYDKPSLDKMKLCEYICTLPKGQLKDIFANIKIEIEKINAIR